MQTSLLLFSLFFAMHSESWTSDRCLQTSFAQLLRGAHSNVEVAAFVVVDARGALSCLVWPRMAWIRSQSFHGRIPNGTVAIVHTHPPHEERPSGNDIAESRRIGMPFFVVTATAVWVFDPSTELTMRTTASPDWIAAAARNCPDPR